MRFVGGAALEFEDDVQGVDDAGDVTCGGRRSAPGRWWLGAGQGFHGSFGTRKGNLLFAGLRGSWRLRGSGGSNVPRIVKQMLMQREAPQPTSRKTPRGGRRMAKMILQMSL